VRHFLFERWRQGQCLVEFARLIFLFGFFWIAQFLVWLSQFFVFVSAAVGTIFVGLVGILFCLAFAFLRKNCWGRGVSVNIFILRRVCAVFLLELDRGALLGFRSFCGRGVVTGTNFVELALLNFGVGVAHSGSAVGLSQFFCLKSGAKENALLTSRG
jgi:hypothetical protein